MPVLEIITSSGLGSLLGMRHALEPDHLTAVSTLVAGERGSYRAAMLGAFWGLGHTLSLVVVGAVDIGDGVRCSPVAPPLRGFVERDKRLFELARLDQREAEIAIYAGRAGVVGQRLAQMRRRRGQVAAVQASGGVAQRGVQL